MSNESVKHYAGDWAKCTKCGVKRPREMLEVIFGGESCIGGCAPLDEPRTVAVESPVPTPTDGPRWAKPEVPEVIGAVCALCKQPRTFADLKEVTISDERKRHICVDSVGCLERHESQFDQGKWNAALQEELTKAGALKDTGIKYDGGKSRLDLVPMRALTEVGYVLTAGAERYGPNNWRKVIGWRWRYMGAALRHVAAYLMGKRIDDEGKHTTRRQHLACAITSLMFVLENDLANEAGDTTPDGDAR